MSPIVTAPPKSQQVADAIRREITTGQLQAGERLLTVRQFAQRFDVSNQVVQSAFAILKKAGLIGIPIVGRGTFVAETVAPQTSPSVTMILDGTRDSHTRLPILLSAELQRRGFLSCMLDCSTTSDGHSRDEIRALLESRPRALIVDAHSLFQPDVLTWRADDTQLIVVKRHEMELPGDDIFYALLDYVQAGYLAGTYLLATGCKQPVMLNFERQPGWTSDLLATGLEQALAEQGLTPTFLDHTLSIDDITEAVSTLQPDGIFCYADYVYRSVRSVTERLGLQLNTDFAAIGYGNTPWAEAYGISSIEPREDKLAEAVADHLENGTGGGRLVIEPELYTR